MFVTASKTGKTEAESIIKINSLILNDAVNCKYLGIDVDQS